MQKQQDCAVGFDFYIYCMCLGVSANALTSSSPARPVQLITRATPETRFGFHVVEGSTAFFLALVLHIMSGRMPFRMSEYMSHRMLERLPGRMSAYFFQKEWQ